MVTHKNRGKFVLCPSSEGLFVFRKEAIMWNKPTRKELSAIPRLYATDTITAKDKIIHMHFFLGSSDWFAVEFDGEDHFFGYVILNDDEENSEWGYFSLAELESINFLGFQIDRDIHWKPIRAGDVSVLRGLI